MDAEQIKTLLDMRMAKYPDHACLMQELTFKDEKIAALEAENARLREELQRVRQCYLTLREGRGVLPDEEINPGCYESDLMRVECKKMAAMREALRECVKDYDKNLIFEAFPDNPFSASIRKAREVLGDDPITPGK